MFAEISLTGGWGGGRSLALEYQPALEAADVPDLDKRDADDAEQVGRVGGEEIGLNDADDLQDEGRRRAHHADVQAAVEEVLLIVHETELEERRGILALDLPDLAEACHVHSDLERGKYAD